MSCRQHKPFKPAKVRKLLALPGVSKSVRDEEEGIDEGVNPDDEEVIAVRSRKKADLIVEAQSSKHQFNSFTSPRTHSAERVKGHACLRRMRGPKADRQGLTLHASETT